MPHLRRLLPYLRAHRHHLAGGLVCLLLTTLLSVATPWVLRLAVDDLTLRVTQRKLGLYAGLVVGLALVEGVFRYLMRMVLIGMSREIEYELRNDLFRHLTRLPASYFRDHRIGDLMSRANSDMSAVRLVLGPGIMYTANTLATSVGALALMLAISPRLLGLAVVPLVFVSWLVRYFGRRIHDRFEAVQAQLASLTAVVQESLAGIRVVRAYVQEPQELARFEAEGRQYLEGNRSLIRMYGSLFPAVQLLTGLGAVMVVLVGGRMAIAGSISLGEFVAFAAYLAMLHWPTIALGWVVNIFERGEASMGRLDQILDTVPEIKDQETEPGPPLQGAVEFRRLSFGYGGEPVLRDIDLSVPAGSTVAIVGPTGCGKSTLVSLLPRLYQAPPGTVFVDGRDVRRIPLGELRAAVGLVPQETFLFSASVRENLAFGLPGDGASRVEWAAQVAQLAGDIAAFPQGYETFVGERGITLSGGQKQRAALARALAGDPRILILDDALSAVDTETEEGILSGLRQVMRNRTTFLVSHRVSTVREADLIVVLREGRIVERGNHQELLALGGFYADLHRRQQLEEEMEKTA
ncbi:MAG TPA: ABC transporter ATP-binding protein [Vicinamibacteria bacterium]|nr:ABC transporter ATP-binding protein [Vicinamibacteria bacterium]